MGQLFNERYRTIYHFIELFRQTCKSIIKRNKTSTLCQLRATIVLLLLASCIKKADQFIA